MRSKRKRPQISPADKARIGQRSGWLCHICGQGADRFDPWEFEHLVAYSHRALSGLDNYRLAHRSCNLIKGADSWIAGPVDV